MSGTPAPGGTPGGAPAGTPVATPASTVVVSESAAATTVSAADDTSEDSTTVVSQSPDVVTQVVTPSEGSPSVILQTSVVTAPDRSREGSSGPVVVFSTAYSSPATSEPEPTSRNGGPTSTSSAPASLNTGGGGGGGDNDDGGLGTPGTVAVAVVVPVVGVALIVLAIIFWWRKRKQRKTAEDARRKEVEEYGYNPNNDPTLPAVGGTAGSNSPEMEDTGYRGWGSNNNNAGNSSARKPSTNLSSNIGMAVSDHSPGSPGHGTMSDGSHSGEPLVDGHDAYDGVGAGGAAAAGAAGYKNKNPPAELGANGMKRGPSNASSQYSAAGHTDTSDDATGPDHGYDTNYSQFTPYRQGTGNTFDDSAQPVIRDVDARRNTKIENPSTLPRQGNSGIAANF
ncbi:MAG: hypothetical protein M1831_003363 [Alyxoria varia]|nr:MAG: hypothetical protein M1831_003363 [Alyxoria varia]